jgi:hypothetical protein
MREVSASVERDISGSEVGIDNIHRKQEGGEYFFEIL